MPLMPSPRIAGKQEAADPVRAAAMLRSGPDAAWEQRDAVDRNMKSFCG